MTLPLNPAMAMTEAPPVMEARRWLAETALPPGLDLINVSQAAPVDPPPEALRAAIAEAALNDPAVHLYGPVLGLPALRAEVAAQWSVAYGGAIDPAQVAITQGCNQAFCAVMATLAGAGDAVMLPVPWYFNHKMWCDMAGVAVVPLPCGPDMVPDPAAAAALTGPRVKAIVLVTPNNPTGAEYPAGVVEAFFALARASGIALILDETYRDFDARAGAPHGLFAREDWAGTLIHLYSFSKAYRLTGHRVGAIVADAGRLAQVEKFLDTVAICPPQLGQAAALWGMRNLAQWLAGERAEILDRRGAVTEGFARLPGWRLAGCGAYFAWALHPFAVPSDAVARAALAQQGILMLPGTMFAPPGDPRGTGALRIAFANADRAGIGRLIDRLAALALPRA
jgi:aspartate/methionine/tyrosine aminotransferase